MPLSIDVYLVENFHFTLSLKFYRLPLNKLCYAWIGFGSSPCHLIIWVHYIPEKKEEKTRKTGDALFR